MVKDRNISIRVDGDLWELFKAAATARTTSAADAIDTLMRDYLDMPSQSLPIDLADRLGIVEARLDTLENKAIAPIQNIRRGIYQVEPLAIEPNKSVPRSSNGKINVVELAKTLGCKDAQIGRWIRGSVSFSTARVKFDRWCETNPAAHQELVDRFPNG
jgi:hypothetical protein